MSRLVHHLVPAVFGLLAFTNPQGGAVYVDADSISAISPGAGFCERDMTRLDLSGVSYCVRESVEAAVKAVKGAADDAEDEAPDPRCATAARYQAMAEGVDCSK